MKNIISILLIPLIISYFFASVKIFSHLPYYWPKVNFFIFGCLFCIMIYMIFFRKKTSRFWLIFGHEFTHLIFALLMFKKPSSFLVESNLGGFIGFRASSNFILALAPYFFPTFTVILLLLKPAVNHWYYNYYQFFMGLTFGFHLIMTLKQARPWQPDFRATGVLFAYVFTILMNIISITIIFVVLMEDWNMAWIYLKDGFINLYSFFRLKAPIPFLVIFSIRI